MNDIKIGWKVGYEIELLAPPNLNRRDLANKVCSQHDGAKVVNSFLPQAEFSLVENAPIFENLTLAFDVQKPDGSLIARFADDLTLLDGLDRNAPPKPGWYRIISDDARFLRLIMRHVDPNISHDKILEPAAELFGVELEHLDGGVARLADSHNSSIAMAAPLPGERERPCEIISAPIQNDHARRLEALLDPVRELNFTIPEEAALHIHYDATDLCDAKVFSNIVRIFSKYGDALKQLVGTNPKCRRLSGWPDALIELISHPEFEELSWEEVCLNLVEIKLSKFVDFNLVNMVYARPEKHTFEVRILPVSMDVQPIIMATALFEGILRYAIGQPLLKPAEPNCSFSEFIEDLSIDERVIKHWQAAC